MCRDIDTVTVINHKSAIYLLSFSNNNDCEKLNGQGDSLYKLGKYQDAVQCYEKVLAIEPDYIEALKGKGYSLYRLGKY